MTLLNQLVRDMNRKIERQKERAILESSARPVSVEDKARLDAIKAGHLSCLSCSLHALRSCLMDPAAVVTFPEHFMRWKCCPSRAMIVSASPDI